MKLVIISGVSGSGKTIALQALEDLGFYCIDNLPLGLLSSFAQQLVSPSQRLYQGAAVGVDVRNLVDDFQNFKSILAEVKDQGLDVDLIFLDADDQTLIKRFSETRRRHPLTNDKTSLVEAIQRERSMLRPIAASADGTIDTSTTTLHQLRDLIRGYVRVDSKKGMSLLLQSFGFKHGAPRDADFIFDVRCLPNPHWIAELRGKSGKDKEVIEFLEGHRLVLEMRDDLIQFLQKWIPRFEADNRAYLTVQVGCTGGQHRSVYLVETLSAHFARHRDNVIARHRELT